MRVLLVGHSLLTPWVDYSHRALERLGHAVRRFTCTNLLLDRLTLPRDKDRDGQPRRAEGSQGLRAAWHRWRDKSLVQAARAFHPDLILVLWGNTLSPELLLSLKEKTGSRLVTWWVDDPFRHHAQSLIPLYDFFFIFDRSYLAPLREHGAQEVRFLPCACDETVYYPRQLTPREQARYASDVALVAWYYPDRTPIVQALTDFNLKIWGRHWTSPDAQLLFGGIPRQLAEGDLFVRDVVAAKIYSATKIGLNIHSDQTRRGGIEYAHL